MENKVFTSSIYQVPFFGTQGLHWMVNIMMYKTINENLLKNCCQTQLCPLLIMPCMVFRSSKKRTWGSTIELWAINSIYWTTFIDICDSSNEDGTFLFLNIVFLAFMLLCLICNVGVSPFWRCQLCIQPLFEKLLNHSKQCSTPHMCWMSWGPWIMEPWKLKMLVVFQPNSMVTFSFSSLQFAIRTF